MTSRRPGAWSRDRLRSDALRWARRNIGPLAGVAGMLLAGLILSLFLPYPTAVRGLFAGVFLTCLVEVLIVVPILGSGGLSKLWGVGGENATADVLESRRRRRQGWLAVHGLILGDREIDHIAIGPAGVAVIETKWVMGAPWKLAGGELVGPIKDPVSQAREGAKRLAVQLRHRRHGGHDVDVTPMVIVWGPGTPELPDGDVEVQGVRIFTGREIDRFERWLDQRRLDEEPMKALQRSLRDYESAQIEQLSRKG